MYFLSAFKALVLIDLSFDASLWARMISGSCGPGAIVDTFHVEYICVALIFPTRFPENLPSFTRIGQKFHIPWVDWFEYWDGLKHWPTLNAEGGICHIMGENSNFSKKTPSFLRRRLMTHYDGSPRLLRLWQQMAVQSVVHTRRIGPFLRNFVRHVDLGKTALWTNTSKQGRFGFSR